MSHTHRPLSTMRIDTKSTCANRMGLRVGARWELLCDGRARQNGKRFTPLRLRAQSHRRLQARVWTSTDESRMQWTDAATIKLDDAGTAVDILPVDATSRYAFHVLVDVGAG